MLLAIPLRAEIHKVQRPDDGLTIEDSLGTAMAMNAGWAVLGAPDDSCGLAEGATGSSGHRSGSAYVFRQTGGTWNFQSKWRAPTPRQGGRYGRAVALHGDTIAIASNRHPSQVNMASVHVYAFSGQTWTLQAELAIPGEITSAPVLALEGNMLLAANPAAGTVHVFGRSGQSWSWMGNLAAALALPANSGFGSALVLSGNRAFIGAPGSSLVPGVIYEFGYASGAWSWTRTIPSPAGEMYDHFGKALVLQNGFLVAGARVPSALQASPPASANAGRVYIFADMVATWSLVRTIQRPAGVTALEWGNTIAPGTNRVIIGADVDSGDGKAFFQSLEMVGTGAGLWSLAPLPSPAGTAHWSAGSRVASFGDTLWQGGGPQYSSQGTVNRYVHRFTYTGPAWSAQGRVEDIPPSQLQAQPKSLISAGADVVLSTPLWSTVNQTQGIVHVFGLVQGRWALKQTIRNPLTIAATSWDMFGDSVSYSPELDKLVICGFSRIHFYTRAPDQSWVLQTSYPQPQDHGWGAAMWCRWDKDMLYVGTMDWYAHALKLTNGRAVEVTSRRIRLPQFSIVHNQAQNIANNYFAAPVSADDPGQTLVLHRHTGQAWTVARSFTLPAASYAAVPWGMTPDNLALTLQTGLDPAHVYDFAVLTSAFKNGQWQPLREVTLPPSPRYTFLSTLAMEGKSMLLPMSRVVGQTIEADTALVMQSASGEWRFVRWLGFPANLGGRGAAIAGSYAAVLGNEHFSQTGHVELQSLAEMTVYDGPATEDTRVASGSMLDWGGHVFQGLEARRTLTVKNTGAGGLTLKARIEGANSADFQLSGLPAGPLHPADEVTLTLTVKPGAVGTRDARLILTPGTPDLPEWVLDIDATGTNTIIRPETPQSVEHAILERGSAWHYRPVFTNTRPLRIEWRKNGQLIGNPHQDYLSLLSLQPGDAGEYEARASNDAGQASVRVHIAVYEGIVGTVPIRSSVPVKLPVRFWGAGAVSWSVQDVPAVYSGRNTPTLTLLSPKSALNEILYGDYARSPTATLQLGTATQVIAKYYLETQLPPRILRVPEGDRAVTGGADGSVEVEQSVSAPNHVFSATGLPRGMSIESSNGQVSGNFTQAGTYTVTWRVTNAYGSDAVSSVFRVSSNPQHVPTPGVYGGLISDGLRSGGFETYSAHLMVQMGQDGFFTCQFRYKNVVRRFNSRFVPSAEFGGEPAAILPLGTLSSDAREAVLRLAHVSIPQTDTFIAGLSFKDADGTPGYQEGVIVRVFRLSTGEQELYTGDFAGLMQPAAGAPPTVPAGTGLCSLRISSDGTSAVAAGTLADGTAFTLGSALSHDTIPVYFHDAATLNSLCGWMPLFPNTPLVWNRPGDGRRRLYPAAFETTLNNQFKKRRGTPAPGKLLLTDVAAGPLNVRMTARWDAASVLDTTFTLTTGHQAVFPAPNMNRVSVDFYSPTGFFTGKFNVPGEGTTTRTVRFSGMMLPGLNIGEGFFLLPKLAEPDNLPPTTSANSPILSGRITIAPSAVNN